MHSLLPGAQSASPGPPSRGLAREHWSPPGSELGCDQKLRLLLDVPRVHDLLAAEAFQVCTVVFARVAGQLPRQVGQAQCHALPSRVEILPQGNATDEPVRLAVEVPLEAVLEECQGGPPVAAQAHTPTRLLRVFVARESLLNSALELWVPYAVGSRRASVVLDRLPRADWEVEQAVAGLCQHPSIGPDFASLNRSCVFEAGEALWGQLQLYTRLISVGRAVAGPAEVFLEVLDGGGGKRAAQGCEGTSSHHGLAKMIARWQSDGGLTQKAADVAR
jgi:hypothetical protein